MYDLEIKPEADKIFKKLSKKNPKRLRTIFKKIKEIQENPNHIYKFLKGDLQKFNRVHIEKHFVLIFSINSIQERIIIYYFDHHDYVYKWRK